MRKSNVAVFGGIVLLLAVAGGGVAFYMSIPHTPEAQYAYAEKIEKALRAKVGSGTPGALDPEATQLMVRAIEQYRRVGEKFGASQKAADGLKRVAKIHEEVGGDPESAIKDLDELASYKDEANSGYALIEQARLLKGQGETLKGGVGGGGAASADAAVKKYREAIAKLEAYRKQFEKGGSAEQALMESGRIWQDGIGDPLIKPIEVYTQIIKDYPEAEDRPEAMYRLATLYQKIKEYQKALAVYSQLLEEFPKNKWADQATFARAQILDDQMKKHDEAAKEFDRLKKDYPESPLAGQAGGEARKARGEQAKEEGEAYGKSRYGGAMPYDTIRDKPLPPAGMFKQFAEQKLDAQKYDMDVTFLPSDHRITVKGTLSLINHGEEKKSLLLMLGAPLEVTSLEVDGVAVKSEHEGETLKITLPTALKKEGAATVKFAYSGQYAEPMPGDDIYEPMEKNTTTAPTSGEEGPTTGSSLAPKMPTDTRPKYPMNPQIGLGSFGYGLSGASWYPITIIGDVFDAHLTIHLPSNQEAVANGVIVKRERSTDPTKESFFEFATKVPTFGLYFAYGPYVMQEKQVGDIHYYTYLREKNASKSDAYITGADSILAFYAKRYVAFPYEKMALVETPLPPFLGGVGPASLMFIHEKMVAHSEVPENLLAHELAHQWFGNLIPINITDPNYSQWLSEGFATYSDALYTEHTSGPKALAMHMQRYEQLYFQFALMAARGQGAIKTTYPDSPLYRPVIYEKGAIALHMLRKVLGDDKFFALMREFIEKYKNKPSTVDDFEKMASDKAGQDLTWFFTQWIDGTVFAHWVVKDVTIGELKDGKYPVSVTIDQPDDVVKMPADVTFIGEKGERSVKANVMLDQRESILDVPQTFKPVKVIVDEDFWVLHRPGSDNVWPQEKVAAAK